MRILVTGGAGYIGSHTCRELFRQGFQPVVFDNLSSGHEYAVKWGPLVQGDIHDESLLIQTIQNYKIEAVIHFAAHIDVAESMRDPQKYFYNNTAGARSVLEAMMRTGVNKFVFSSTAAVYGNPAQNPIDETCPTQPINPYGESKLRVENILNELGSEGRIRGVALRYFNACGASPDGDIGEDHHPETHLIPLTIRACLDESFTLTLFGTDFPTPDGTCIRDYVHVLDLADAHIRALKYLNSSTAPFETFNLGTGKGFSNREIITTVEEQLKLSVKLKVGSRRPGDPPVLVASNEKAHRILGWTPTRDLKTIITNAGNWYRKCV